MYYNSLSIKTSFSMHGAMLSVSTSPAGGGRNALAPTIEPRHAPTATSWAGGIALKFVLLTLAGRRDITPSDAGSIGAGAGTGVGAAAIMAAALSCQPALASRRALAAHASRSTCAAARAPSPLSAWTAKWRAMASATGPHSHLCSGWRCGRCDE